MADRYGPMKDSGRTLHRGTGCHVCRQRKVKCDGVRPSCSRCTKSNVECSYDEEVKKSKITLLRDEITLLRRRIQDLEADAQAKIQAGLLPVPVSPAGSWANSPALSDTNSLQNPFRVLSPDQKPPFGLVPPVPVDPTFSQFSDMPGDGFQASMLQGGTGWREVAPSVNGGLMFSLDQTPTTEETLHNLQVIMPYRVQCGFEIDVAGFQESLGNPDPEIRPHEALLNAIALMACYYDQSLREANRAQIFVDRTRRSLQCSLTGIRSRKVIQQIQAGHLLACYLYWTGSLLEGHAALAGAVSLARLCNLHKITSSDWRNRSDNLLEEVSVFRPQLRPLPSMLNYYPARNALEHGERIHCFWNLLLVDTGGSVSTGYPCQFTASDSDPGTKIETVYPLALQDYMSVSARAQEPTSAYGDIFFPRLVSAEHDTPLVARIKAALLLHRAARLGTVGKTVQHGQDQEFTKQWVNLNECIDKFISTLKPMPVSAQPRPRGDAITDERRDFLYMFIAWSLILCAQVVMYNITPIAWRNTQMQTEAWLASDKIVQIIITSNPSEDELKMLDVMVGYAWMTSANFLINMRNLYEQGSDKGLVNFDLQYAERQLDILDQAAHHLAKTCRPVVRQAQGTREFRARSSGPYQAAPDGDQHPAPSTVRLMSSLSASHIPFIRRRDGTLVYSSGTYGRSVPIPVPSSYGSTTKEMDMRDLDKEEDLLDYADGGYLPVHIGDTFKDGRYTIVRKLGWGHFSTVWLAKDQTTNRHVAIKVVKSAKTYVTAARDEVGILRFINSVYKDPGHENIVQFLDTFDHKVDSPSTPSPVHICMVFEPLGASLLTLIKAHRKGVPEHLVRQIATQVLAGLAFLHERCGIIHTDLKPENIMISLGGKQSIEAIVQAELATSPRSLSRMVGIPPGCVRGGVATPRYGADLAGTKQVWIFGSQPLPTSVSLPRTRSGQPDGLVRKMSALAISAMSQAAAATPSSSASSSSTFAEALSTAPTSFMSTGKGAPFGSTRSQKCAPVNKVSPVTIVCQSDGNGATVTASSETTLGNLPEQPPRTQSTGLSDDPVGFTKTSDIKPCTPTHKGPSLLSQTAPKLEPLTRSKLSPIADKDTIEVKIGDLGNASYCWKHFTENIQTRQYRCPEVILGAEWDATADIWSVGCIFFELLTSDVLFEPAERPGVWSRDDDHICQMIELLGPMPPKFALSGDYSKEIFRSDGVTLRNVPTSKMSAWPLLDVLTQKYRYERGHAEQLCEFLLPFLRLEPKQRTSAQDALRLEWLKSS